ncbi:MAG: potassium/proton antiporter [Alphaproteobacteria bacterium ADurb.Bin438]|nr:MAG: potassium/proton antiporter [Alphaproteobacteria bacterium ADurb.Bin438]
MLASLGIVLLTGMFLGAFFKKLKLPSLIGMLLTGIILGPYFLNLIDKSILNISSELRQVALIIILTRAGLALDVDVLKKVGRSALLMCFVPACFEILAFAYFAPKFLGVSLIEAVLMGSVVAAVSPAVIVPKMLQLIDEKYGKNKGIPQMIMAGASVDDVFVIVIFSSFLSLASGGNVSVSSFAQIPSSIILGVLLGVISGFILNKFFKKFHLRDTAKVIMILSISFLLVAFEHLIKDYIMISSLLSIMAIGATIQRLRGELAIRLQAKYNKLWVFAEILLFVLVGATVDLNYAKSAGIIAIILIFTALIFRMMGVIACMLNSELNLKERSFCMIAYMPKATVQAAIGGLPLSMGLACGNVVLTVAVLSVIITAPLGSFLIDLTYKRYLSKDV